MSDVFADALTRQEYYDKFGESYFKKLEQEGKKEDRTMYAVRAEARGRMQLRELEELGYSCSDLTDFQTRINGVLDVWWRNQKYHNTKTNTRGDFDPRRMREMVEEQIGKP